MPKAEWRLFIPIEEGASPPSATKILTELLEHVEPAVRTDVYVKADADTGVKKRVRVGRQEEGKSWTVPSWLAFTA